VQFGYNLVQFGYNLPQFADLQREIRERESDYSNSWCHISFHQILKRHFQPSYLASSSRTWLVVHYGTISMSSPSPET